MAYNEEIAGRIAKALSGTKNLAEKKMFGGIAFLINDKMCIGVHKEEIIIRCSPEMTDELLSKKGVRMFDITGKPMKGWLLVAAEATRSKKDFDWWVKIAVEANKLIEASKKKK